MFENPRRRGRQARNFATNVPKILDLKSSSEQIFSKNCRWVPLKVLRSCLSVLYSQTLSRKFFSVCLPPHRPNWQEMQRIILSGKRPILSSTLEVCPRNLPDIRRSTFNFLNHCYVWTCSLQGFSGIIYNTDWGTLPDCLRCSLQVMKELVKMPPYMSVKVR